MRGSSEAQGLAVSIKLNDGSVLRGCLVAGITGKLEPTLNKDTPFVEFVSQSGTTSFISKSQIATVEPLEALKRPELIVPGGGSTCYQLLKVPEDCSFDQAKASYHKLVKLYHPDHYSNAQLPPEVVRYATDMFSQISAAFAEIRERFNKAA